MSLNKGAGFVLWLFFVHLAGIYLFTRGFLLSRLSLPNSSECEDCRLKPTHQRAVLLIIDSLRYDFVSPHPPLPNSPFHHNVLSLPRELTAAHPDHSFLFDTYSDPPTATLQRIKAITTGSLPTFVDIGNNFGASSILEDSLIKQLRLENKNVAFMGDDTWISVYPDSFHPNMTFPFDSFNVEDLHTVDNGVIQHLFPLLEDPSKPFDFIVGHFLGVDHVGHRLGPEHPTMRAKLEQMNDVLKRVVETLQDDTLLIVMGDHGMDKSGDHGGDGALETSAALWIYSKGPALADHTAFSAIPESLLTYVARSGVVNPVRQIQQIDLVPTLSHLLGLRIPYNNLGSVIPELFWKGDGLEYALALRLNAQQIMDYLRTYRASSSGGELDAVWADIEAHWSAAQGGNPWEMTKFNRFALEACRAIWAQFNPFLMGLGLALFGTGLLAAWGAYSSMSANIRTLDKWSGEHLPWLVRALALGSVVGVVGQVIFGRFLPGMDALDCALFAAPFISCLTLLFRLRPTLNFITIRGSPILLILHSISFLSNSFTFWEDRLVLYLLMASIIPFFLLGFTAPTARLRYRILGFGTLFAICARLISVSTVCREEQQPYCHVSFYTGQSTPPPLILALIFPACLALPVLIDRLLALTKSNMGVFPTFRILSLVPSLLLGSAFWVTEWADISEILGSEWSSTLRASRTALAAVSTTASLVVGLWLWWTSPLCLDIQVKKGLQGGKSEVNVVGYANAFGSPYLIFWLTAFSMVYLTSQLTGQIVLILTAIALLAYLEVIDSCRDVRAMEAAFASSTPSAVLDINTNALSSSPVRFLEVVPIALLGLLAFYGTGHQSTISSIQWKSAFIFSSTVKYPFSPLTVIINSLGPLFLAGLAIPLVALWNRAPLTAVVKDKSLVGPPPDSQIRNESVLASLGIMIYYAALLLGTATSVAVLRRHLMVWKVFAPRFMTAVVELMAVDVGVIIGLVMGVSRVGNTIVHLLAVMHGQK